MPKPQPKKHFQIQRMFGLAKEPAERARWSTKEHLETIAATVTNGRVSSLSELTFDEANAIIVRLGGSAFPLYSKRTENHRKQQAGIKTIETDAQLQLIRELAILRNWSVESLNKFCQRVIKKDLPTTTEEGNKIVEGLKAMNRRDGLLAFPARTETVTDRGPSKSKTKPKFRRVA
jgi:hypothetical protein